MILAKKEGLFFENKERVSRHNTTHMIICLA
jgi:hypothetical protein